MFSVLVFMKYYPTNRFFYFCFRVFSPTLLGSLFAWSINDEKHKVFFPLDYHLAFFTIALFILIIGILSIMLPRSINLPKQTALTDIDSEEEISAATKS